jgi:hypothetical protein
MPKTPKHSAKTAQNTPQVTGSTFIGALQADSEQQTHMSLGHYTAAHRPKGFAVELSAEDEQQDTAVAQIFSQGTPRHYELVLRVTNHGRVPVTASVWQM